MVAGGPAGPDSPDVIEGLGGAGGDAEGLGAVEEKSEGPEVTEESSEETEVTEEGAGEIEVAARSLGKQRETDGRVEGKEEADGGEEEIEQTDGAALEPEGQPEARPGATEEQEQLQEEGKDEEDVEEEEVVLKGFGVEEEGEEEIVLNFNLTEEGEEEVKGSEEGEEEERDQEESVEEEKKECGSPVGRRLRTRVSAVGKAPLEEAKAPVEEVEEPKKEEEVIEEGAEELEPEEVGEAKEEKEGVEERMERKRRVSRQSSAESTEEEGVARRLRTRTAPAAMETDTAAEARAEPKVEPKEEAKEESVVVNVPRKKLRKDKTEFQHSAQARSEADVLKRVGELQREGLWGGKKLAKREGEGHGQGKIHWDFVLEEMVWLAGVVQQEVKTKKVNAKKCAMMIQKHFKDKELAVARAERTREANLRKIALTMAREVKTFWSNVNKLFEYRLKIKLDSKKKEALDQHLNFIVDKTEKYSSLLAESLAVEQGSASASASVSANPSRAESVMSEEEVQGEGDDEYSPDVDSDDDEETIEKEEEEPAAAEEKVTNEEEIGMLENEAEVPIEDLLKKYYPDTFEHMTSGAVGEEEKVENKEEKFEDKETKPAPKEEEELKEEGETGRGKRRRKPIDFEEVQARILEEEEFQKKKEESTEGVGEGTKEATEMTKKTDEEDKKDGEDKLDEYAAMAAELAPTGNTLATTTVKTKVPYLLKHTMREYQHIGLDWMVSLFERSLNGILADEMGLGKTIQTIAFLGHLALERGMWGPHLIVVPTSVMLNWEMEIKKWFPAFKVLVYYGSQKDRKLKRVGWTKQNAFHICITSYKLVIQDHSSFRRFKWQYFILDEAQHIKNFKSQRWQLLLNFTSLGRLLLTGTPLQNNLMELWSLMHFLMPHVFESHRDFKEWFSNPMAGMVEGNSEYNDSLIKRLHKVLRPFILRRLKAEVEKQMPKKVNHLVKCPLSKRQRFLYDDFMCRAKTKDTLASGNLLSVINVLMQLRKCCNHPNLFEPRPTLSPFVLEASDAPRVAVPAMAAAVLAYRPLEGVDLAATPLLLAPLETQESAYTWFRASELRAPAATMLRPPPDAPAAACPRHRVRLVVKAATPPFPTTLALTHQIPHKFCQLEAHPTGQVVPLRLLARPDLWLWSKHVKIRTADGYYQPKGEEEVVEEEQLVKVPVEEEWHPPLVWRREGKRKVEEVDSPTRPSDPYTDTWRHSRGVFSTALFRCYGDPSRSPTKVLGSKRRRLEAAAREAELELPELEAGRRQALEDRRRLNLRLNEARTSLMPVYGAELVAACREASANPSMGRRRWLEELHPPSCTRVAGREVVTCYSSSLVPRVEEVVAAVMPVFRQFVMYVPAVAAAPAVPEEQLALAARESRYAGDFLHSRFQIQTPDTRLIQYDCGKLQVLSSLLRTLFSGGHRVLVFTQMTKMLDVLEAFLNFHGYVYMRLDGSTKVEMRQCLMERFNNDNKYFAFILSTRSGGVGINLTGADTVIFYDSDWNPTMDAQAQDRCHRIGQTRDVHIYRLVSERTVEENILKKANQKRLLGDIAIEGGNFTTAFFKKSTITDLFDNNAAAEAEESLEAEEGESTTKSIGAFETALATAEDDTDIKATREARAEENQDENDFKEEEDQFQAVLAELSAVERLALRYLEEQGRDYVRGQLEAAEAEIEARREEFDAEKLEELTKEIREEIGDESTDEEEEEEEGDQVEEEESEEEASEEEHSDAETSDMDVGDFDPNDSGSDDEVTIAKAEKEDQKEEFEINMLENEAEVPIEDLLKLYYPDQLKLMKEEMGEVEAEVEELVNGEEEGRRKTTRSRGAVEINLWDLQNPQLK